MVTQNREVENKIIDTEKFSVCKGYGYLKSELSGLYQNCYRCKGYGYVEVKPNV